MRESESTRNSRAQALYDDGGFARKSQCNATPSARIRYPRPGGSYISLSPSSGQVVSLPRAVYSRTRCRVPQRSRRIASLSRSVRTFAKNRSYTVIERAAQLRSPADRLSSNWKSRTCTVRGCRCATDPIGVSSFAGEKLFVIWRLRRFLSNWGKGRSVPRELRFNSFISLDFPLGNEAI